MYACMHVCITAYQCVLVSFISVSPDLQHILSTPIADRRLVIRSSYCSVRSVPDLCCLPLNASKNFNKAVTPKSVTMQQVENWVSKKVSYDFTMVDNFAAMWTTGFCGSCISNLSKKN